MGMINKNNYFKFEFLIIVKILRMVVVSGKFIFFGGSDCWSIGS